MAAARLPLSALPLHELMDLDGVEVLRRIAAGTLPAPPFSETTDIWLVEAELGRAVFEGRPSERFLNPIGVVHGGWTAAILDSAMACAVHSTLKPGEGYTTIEFKLNLVRAVMPDAGTVRCEGKVIHRGGRFATSQGRLLDKDGKLLAHGTETCAILVAASGRA